MSVDSAVWYIEALLNYQYGIITDSSEIYYETKTDSAFFNTNTTKGKIEIMDVVSAFFEIENVVVDGLKDIKHPNKRIDIIDVEFKNGQFVAYFQYNYGEQVFGGKYLYNITDNWQWGLLLGNCSGQYIGERDLTTEIKKWIKYNRAVLYNVTWSNVSHNSNGQGFYYDPHLPDYPFPEQIGLDVYDYGGKLFTMVGWFNTPNPDLHYCVSQNMCNYWANETNKTITIIENNHLFTNNGDSLNDQYKYVGIHEFRSMWFHGVSNEYTYVFHRLRFIFGIPHQTMPQN